MINLYYNRHIDPDLSEQMYVDCLNSNDPPMSTSFSVNPACSGTNFCYPGYQLCVVKEHGLPDEWCDPFANRGPTPPHCSTSYVCSDWQSRIWKISGFHDYKFSSGLLIPQTPSCPSQTWDLSEDEFKKKLIQYGPMSSGPHLPWFSHAEVLVGYETDPQDGRTIWIFKNSWGEGWGMAGYDKMKLNLSEIGWGLVPLGPVIPPAIVPPGFIGQVNCVDNDGDGFCNWGISEAKPATCPASCGSQKDCDDSNNQLGPFDQNFNCLPLTNGLVVSVDGKTATTVSQDGSYTLRFEYPDGSAYSGPFDVSLLDANGNWSTPVPWRAPDGSLYQAVGGNLIIDLNTYRNQQTGQWISLGDYRAKFRPKGTALAFSSEVKVTVSPLEMANYWPQPTPGSYYEYREIAGIPPTRLRFDIEKNINSCNDAMGLSVYRLTQTNITGNNFRTLGWGNPRYMFEWAYNYLHGFGIKIYGTTPLQAGPAPTVSQGKLGDFKSFLGFGRGGYTSANLPSFLFLPKYLDFNFYGDDFYLKSNNSCGSYTPYSKWAIDIRKLTVDDLVSGSGQGNLQVGDIQVRMIYHNGVGKQGPLASITRQDWFLRGGLGPIRIEESIGKYNEECIEGQHSNFTCWKDPNLLSGAACNCWSRRIHPSLITDGFSLSKFYSPHQLSFIIKESGNTSYTVKRGQYYTVKETSSNYTGYLSEITRPNQIWRAHKYQDCPPTQPNCNEPGVLEDVWMENGEARVYVPLNYTPGTYQGQFRSYIWSGPQDSSAAIEVIQEPSYPTWSTPLIATVVD
jgi:hypothetical protein